MINIISADADNHNKKFEFEIQCNVEFILQFQKKIAMLATAFTMVKLDLDLVSIKMPEEITMRYRRITDGGKNSAWWTVKPHYMTFIEFFPSGVIQIVLHTAASEIRSDIGYLLQLMGGPQV